MTADQLIRALGSRKTTMILIVPVLGLNAAYLLKHGSGLILILTIAILAMVALTMVALAIIAGQLARRGKKEQPRDPIMMDYVQNGMFAFVLIASLYGIFG